MFKSHTANAPGKNLAVRNSLCAVKKGGEKALNDRDLRQFLCHVCHGSISYSMLPKQFSYFTPLLANCQTAVNKDGHVSEKKHSLPGQSAASWYYTSENSKDKDNPNFLVAEVAPTQQLQINFPVSFLSSKLLPPEELAVILHHLSQTAVSHCFAFLDYFPLISKQKMQQLIN